MITKTVKNNICECGFPVLNEGIPIGTEYCVDPESLAPVTLICGGCGKRHHIDAIWVHSRDGGRPGYLPAGIFDLSTSFAT